MLYQFKQDPSSFKALQSLLSARQHMTNNIESRAKDIVDNVAQRGDIAIREYTQQFDGYNIANLQLNKSYIAQMAKRCPKNVRKAIEFSAKRIADFHQHDIPENLDYRDKNGIRMGYRYTPILAAGVYAPGGTAAYPSSVLMSVIPAQIAGVRRIVLCTPTPQNFCHPAVMAAIEFLELSEVYAIGGAQAIAAMAHGSDTICPVDFIAGPGNSYVSAAKKLVYGKVGIDSLAGPSEVTIVADNTANPYWVATDLIAQAEHDPLSQSILITDSSVLAEAVYHNTTQILDQLPRNNIAKTSWENFGAVILVDNLMIQAPLIVDIIAPEHLIIAMDAPHTIFDLVHNVGSIFLGHFSAEAAGDYNVGPNHILPTCGSARYASGLSSMSFMKRTTFQQLEKSSLSSITSSAEIIACTEGLHAHALSLRIRSNI